MRPRLARWIVNKYPRAWRERYADEVRALLDAGRVPWVDVVDLLRSCVSEWKVALADPEHHPRVFELLNALSFLIPKLALLALFALPPIAIASYLQEHVGPPPEWVATTGATLYLLIAIEVLVRTIRRSRSGVGTTFGALPISRLIWWVPLAASATTVSLWRAGLDLQSDSTTASSLSTVSLIVMWYLEATHRPRFMSELAAAMGGRRYLLRWANLELARCESLDPRDSTRAPQLASAQAEVDRLNHELQLIYAAIRERRPLPAELTQQRSS